MKNILYLLIFIPFNFMYAQNVGINTPDGQTPSQTLDINGSMRIRELGTKTNATQPLAWNPDTGQVQRVDPNIPIHNKPIKIIEYIFTANSVNNDYLFNKELDIDSDKYYASITQANLVTEDFSYDNPNNGRTFIKAVLQKKDGTFSSAKVTGGGYIANSAGQRILSDGYYLGVTDAIVTLSTNSNNKYVLNADYDGTGPIDPTKKYKWLVTILVIDKKLIKQ